MSILIKGMDMPEYEKIMVVYPDGYTKIYMRSDMSEVPTPHGRLIDADVAKRQGWGINRTYSVSPKETVYECGELDLLPTVIEAEE